MGAIKRTFDLFVDFFRKLPPSRRVGLLSMIAVVLSCLVALLFWAGSTSYQTLYSNLSSEDATAIMRLLREKKIPFKVEDDGKTVKIPPEAVYDLRLELASSGYPQSGVVGYEILDKQNFSTTTLVQKLNQKRAIEGELIRTINQLKGVKRSRVHLALPQKAVFSEDQKKSTASIVIDLEPGFYLNDKQIFGISHLVASAIEGMEIANVYIVDANGKLLSHNSSDPSARILAANMEIQQKVEHEYEARVEEIVQKIVGEGKVIAKVSVDLDFTQVSETQTLYDQEGATVRSQQKENQQMDGSRPVPSGAPGAASNTPGQNPQKTTSEVKSNTQKNLETTNYAIPETVRRVAKPSFQTKKISVAVLIDDQFLEALKAPAGANGAQAQAQGAADPNQQAKDSAALEAKWNSEKQKLVNLVSSALGIDKARGDIIDIQAMKFKTADLEDAEKQIQQAEQRRLYKNLAEYGTIAILIFLFFLLVVRPFVKWLTDNTTDNIESFLPKTLEELEKLQAQEEGLTTVEEALPVIVDKVDPEKVEGEMIREKIISLIEKNPEKAALILHEWISRPSSVPQSKEASA